MILIFIILLTTWVWWLYLGANTHMVLAQDALTYEYLGRRIAEHGFYPDYFITGPNREPIFPLMVAFGMKIGFWLNLPYTKILTALNIAILLCNQLCLLRILQILKICDNIIAIALLYLGFSPAITNAAFSLYSEIAVFAFILPLFLVLYHMLNAFSLNQHRSAMAYALLIGILLQYLTLIKAPFEIISPVFLCLFFWLLWCKHKGKLQLILACALISFASFALPIHIYKSANQQCNGQYTLTNRASWALYGNTIRRMQPLNTTRILSALAYVPGEGVCKTLFKGPDCDFWSFKTSDSLGMSKLSQLQQTSQNPESINKQLFTLSFDKIISNPLQYAGLTMLEGFKMFFWESTQIGFVDYPSWLSRFYGNIIFKNFVRLLSSALTMCAVFFLWSQMLKRKNEIFINAIGIMIALFIGSYAAFFILTRYSLPLAPLFIIAIAYAANLLYNNRHVKH